MMVYPLLRMGERMASAELELQYRRAQQCLDTCVFFVWVTPLLASAKIIG